ncbi:MAG: TonB-dependent receptor [Candidatus Kapabacteria bacterium]|nr:TonB-dependent receptor [Candidatus Kapabacteria bacterium]
MKRIFSILLWIGLFIIPFTADAGIFGILKGKIKDTDGKPLPGAVVRVQGTNRGSNAKVDGSYQIAQLTSGKYEIQVTFASKDTMKLSVTISADRTTEQDIVMGEKTVRTIFVETKHFDNTSTGSGGEYRSGDITSQAGGSVSGIIASSPGIVAGGSGFEIRGARASESSNRLDGVDIGNAFSGGLGSTGTAYYPSASGFATEAIQVLTGGFGAEYGEATGGITNSVIKTGKIDKFEGFLYYNTDLPSLNGSQASGLKVEKQNTDIKAIETGPGAKLQGKGVNNIEYGFGGYIPGVKGMTFYLSGVNKTEQTRNASYKIFDPLGNNLGQIANGGAWIKSITSRLKYSINDDIDLVIGANLGLTCLENSSWGAGYMQINRELLMEYLMVLLKVLLSKQFKTK